MALKYYVFTEGVSSIDNRIMLNTMFFDTEYQIIPTAIYDDSFTDTFIKCQEAMGYKLHSLDFFSNEIKSFAESRSWIDCVTVDTGILSFIEDEDIQNEFKKLYEYADWQEYEYNFIHNYNKNNTFDKKFVIISFEEKEIDDIIVEQIEF
jgi:hypothetical protein